MFFASFCPIFSTATSGKEDIAAVTNKNGEIGLRAWAYGQSMRRKEKEQQLTIDKNFAHLLHFPPIFPPFF
jgi:hypothetical protein